MRLKGLKQAMFLFVAMLMGVSSAYAEVDISMVMSDIESLLEIPVVSVVSKEDESVVETPGVVKVWTKEDIRRMGAKTLRDLAKMTAGYGIETAYGMSGYQVRGVTGGSGGFDNARVLIMIDGLPINHGRSMYAWNGWEIPMEMAETVEFLKGPSSALYGKSAFLGVINVRTKQVAEGERKSEASIGLIQSEENRNLSGMTKRFTVGTYSNQEDVSVMAYATSTRQKASGEPVPATEAAISSPSGVSDVDYGDANESQSFFTSIKMQGDSALAGTTFGMNYIRMKQGMGYSGWTYVGDLHDYTELRALQPYVKYDKELTDKLSLSSYAFYQEAEEEAVYDASWGNGNYTVNAQTYQIDGNIRYEFDETMNMIFGVAFNQFWQEGDPYGTLNIRKKRTEKKAIYSAYTQFKKSFDVLDGLDLVLGSRYDESRGYEEMSPRFGIVQKFLTDFNAKILYGKAIRAPSIKELGLNDEISAKGFSTDSLGTEKIETLEASIGYYGKKMHSSLTVFTNKIEDAFGRKLYDPTDSNSDGNTENGFTNSSDSPIHLIESNGLEFDFDVAIPNGKFFTNLTYQRPDYKETKMKLDGAEKLKINMGVMYTPEFTEGLDLYLQARHIDYYGIYGNTLVADFNLEKQISENVAFQFKVDNITDKNYEIPETQLADFDFIPQRGREISAYLKVEF